MDGPAKSVDLAAFVKGLIAPAPQTVVADDDQASAHRAVGGAMRCATNERGVPRSAERSVLAADVLGRPIAPKRTVCGGCD